MQRFLVISFVVAIVFLAFPITFAADINVGEGCFFADAITAANNDEAVSGCPAGDGADTISLSSDITLNTVLPHVTTEITIEGGGFTISGNNRYRIFAVNGGNLTVNNLTMIKGNADWGGAIVNGNGGTLSVSYSTISNSKAEEGGAIGNEGTVAINNSEIINNRAPTGGAIHNTGNALNITGSSITDNSSTKRGGAIYSTGETLTISDSILTHNDSEDNGGAIYMDAGKLKITTTFLEGNTSGHVGGAINCDDCNLRIEYSQLRGNVAENGGGAISHWDGGVEILDSIISDNTAKKGGRFSEGGGIRSAGKLLIGRSTISHNEAGNGGGIYSVGGWLTGPSAIRNSLITSNRATAKGGGVYVDDGRFEVIHLTIVNNKAIQGGGVYRALDATVVLYNTIITGSEGRACYGRLEENVANLIEDGSCLPHLSGDPMLGDLVEPEDGSPPYYPLLEGSPAIDAADSLFCPDNDITGTPRPQGDGCDIGAYELPQ